ncbi:MAG: hypothetical protein HY294_06330 [Candidatus Rokubacteria bacterium]|nr:hypothetical protein [Candidatus Rokubacteria bacterium]
MVRQVLLELFKQFPEDVQRTVSRVLEFEQSNITLERPRFKEALREILDEEARDEA